MKTTKDGRPFTTFSVATAEAWLDPQTRERHERTDWHRVGIYRKGLVSLAEKVLGKGSRVYIEGQLRNNRWVDQAGQNRTDTEVAVTSRKGEMIIFSAKPVTETSETAPNEPQRRPAQPQTRRNQR